MPGPAPKDRSQRRRTNKPERGEWVTLPEVDEPILLPLPERERSHTDERGEWHPLTLEMWEAWRQDPATTQYGPAEMAGIKLLAYILDEANWTRKKDDEVRLRETTLGLNLKGKRDLRWHSPSETAAAAAEAEVVPITAGTRRMRAV